MDIKTSWRTQSAIVWRISGHCSTARQKLQRSKDGVVPVDKTRARAAAAQSRRTSVRPSLPDKFEPKCRQQNGAAIECERDGESTTSIIFEWNVILLLIFTSSEPQCNHRWISEQLQWTQN